MTQGEKIKLSLRERMAIANAINFYLRNDVKLQNVVIEEKYDWEFAHLNSSLAKIAKTLEVE